MRLNPAQGLTVLSLSFLANMSHELRTPMHAILSFFQHGSFASA